jgi:hypothetical protein
MAVRLRYKIEAATSSTPAEDRDLGNVKIEVLVDSQGEGGARVINLAAPPAPIPPALPAETEISLGDVSSARFLLIRTQPANQNDPCNVVKIRLNSPTAEQLVISPISPSKEGYFLMTAAGITSLYALNTGTTLMKLTLSVAGD